MNLCEIEKKTVAWQTFKDGDGEVYLFDEEGVLHTIDLHVVEVANRTLISRTDFELCQ